MITADFEAAAGFIVANARIVDRRRFERLFQGGDPAPVRDAVAAYRNADGGFGHALEPDCRAPGSQPVTVEMALRILDEADAWDLDLVTGACDWLASVAPDEGGAAFAEQSMTGYPHAPWWAPQEGHPASLVSTGLLAGVLHARRFQHPWLDRATQTMWRRIDAMADAGGVSGVAGGYEMFGVLRFLQHAPDRERARAAFERVGPMIVDRGLATLEPGAPGEVHTPLDFAPEPDSLARALFDKPLIEAHLDHLARAQLDDGGWTFNWPSWSPAAERDWRGHITVETLRILRANGRL